MDINSTAINASVQKTLASDTASQIGQNQAGPNQVSPVRPVQAPLAGDSAIEDGTQQAAALTEVDPVELQYAVEKLSEFMNTVSNNSLRISVDKDLSRVVLQIVNNENDETIRQFPAEEALNLMKRMRDLSEEFFGEAKGLLVENKA